MIDRLIIDDRLSFMASFMSSYQPVVMRKSRIVAQEAEVSMTAICKDKADADDFAEVEIYEEHLSVLATTPFISRHIRSHETTHFERTFTRTTPENPAYLDSPV